MTRETRTRLALLVGGDLPPERDLTRALGVAPSRARYHGGSVPAGEPRPHDVWIVDLIGRDRWHGPDADPDALERALGILRTMAPGLAAQDSGRCRVELGLSTVRWEREGVIRLPAELIAAAAAGGAEFGAQVACIGCDGPDAAADGDDGERGGPSRNRLSVRVRDEPGCSARLDEALRAGAPGGVPPGTPASHAAGDAAAPGEWSVELIGFEEWHGIVLLEPEGWYERAPDDAVMARAVATLERLAPTLAARDRARCRAELVLRSIRVSDDGGYYLPVELVAAAAAGGLDVTLSIRCALDDEDDDRRGGGEDDEDDGSDGGTVGGEPDEMPEQEL